MDRKKELEDKYARKRLTDLTVDDLPDIIEYVYRIMIDTEADIITDELMDSEFGD